MATRLNSSRRESRRRRHATPHSAPRAPRRSGGFNSALTRPGRIVRHVPTRKQWRAPARRYTPRPDVTLHGDRPRRARQGVSRGARTGYGVRRTRAAVKHDQAKTRAGRIGAQFGSSGLRGVGAGFERQSEILRRRAELAQAGTRTGRERSYFDAYHARTTAQGRERAPSYLDRQIAKNLDRDTKRVYLHLAANAPRHARRDRAARGRASVKYQREHSGGLSLKGALKAASTAVGYAKHPERLIAAGVKHVAHEPGEYARLPLEVAKDLSRIAPDSIGAPRGDRTVKSGFVPGRLATGTAIAAFGSKNKGKGLKWTDLRDLPLAAIGGTAEALIHPSTAYRGMKEAYRPYLRYVGGQTNTKQFKREARDIPRAQGILDLATVAVPVGRVPEALARLRLARAGTKAGPVSRYLTRDRPQLDTRNVPQKRHPNVLRLAPQRGLDRTRLAVTRRRAGRQHFNTDVGRRMPTEGAARARLALERGQVQPIFRRGSVGRRSGEAMSRANQVKLTVQHRLSHRTVRDIRRLIGRERMDNGAFDLALQEGARNAQEAAAHAHRRIANWERNRQLSDREGGVKDFSEGHDALEVMRRFVEDPERHWGDDASMRQAVELARRGNAEARIYDRRLDAGARMREVAPAMRTAGAPERGMALAGHADERALTKAIARHERRQGRLEQRRAARALRSQRVLVREPKQVSGVRQPFQVVRREVQAAARELGIQAPVEVLTANVRGRHAGGWSFDKARGVHRIELVGWASAEHASRQLWHELEHARQWEHGSAREKKILESERPAETQKYLDLPTEVKARARAEASRDNPSILTRTREGAEPGGDRTPINPGAALRAQNEARYLSATRGATRVPESVGQYLRRAEKTLAGRRDARNALEPGAGASRFPGTYVRHEADPALRGHDTAAQPGMRQAPYRASGVKATDYVAYDLGRYDTRMSRVLPRQWNDTANQAAGQSLIDSLRREGSPDYVVDRTGRRWAGKDITPEEAQRMFESDQSLKQDFVLMDASQAQRAFEALNVPEDVNRQLMARVNKTYQGAIMELDNPRPTPGRQSRLMLVDREYAQAMARQLHQQARLAYVARTVFKGVPSRIILGMNPSWLLLQVVNNGTLAGLAGVVDPRDYVMGQRLFRDLAEKDPVLAAEWEGALGGGALMRAERGSHQLDYTPGKRQHREEALYRGPDQGGGPLAKLSRGYQVWRDTLDRHPLLERGQVALSEVGTARILFHGDALNNAFFRRAVAYNRLKQLQFRNLDRSMTRATTNIDRLMASFRQTDAEEMRRLLTDRRALDEVAHSVNEMLGDFTNFTGAERQYLSNNVMFYGFLRFSVRFALYTLPIEHPLTTALLGHLAQLHEDEVRRLLNTGPNDPLPSGALMSIYRMKGGRLEAINLSRLNPLMNPLAQALGMNKPTQLLGVVSPLLGEAMSQLTGLDLYTGEQMRTWDTAPDADPPKNIFTNPTSAEGWRIALRHGLELAAPGRAWLESQRRGRTVEEQSLPWDMRPLHYAAGGDAAKNQAARAREEQPGFLGYLGRSLGDPVLSAATGEWKPSHDREYAKYLKDKAERDKEKRRRAALRARGIDPNRTTRKQYGGSGTGGYGGSGF